MEKENKMGVMPIKKLILTMSLPMMASMLVQALYNVVDSIYVARLGEDALTSVALAFPLQNLMIAFGTGTAVGVNAILSKSLGEKRFDQVNQSANTSLFLTIGNSLLFLFIGLFLAQPFLSGQTNVPYIVENGTAYLRIVNCISFGLFFSMMFEKLLQSTGQSIYSMYTQATGAIINIVVDPVLIFGMFGLPKFGVAGAAIATVIGQIVAASLGLYFNLTKNHEIVLSVKEILKPNLEMIKRIYKIGIPSILMMSIGSLMNFMMNKILITFSTTANAVFGVYFKLQSFFFMPIFGLNSGVVPVLAYNYGAKRKDRINGSLKFALVLAIGVMSVGTIVMNVFPETLLKLFKASDAMLEIGIPALRIISLQFPIAAASIILGSTFQAFGKGIYSLITSVARQIVILIPVAWLLSLTGNINNVWFSFLIAEAVSLMVSLYLFRRLYRNYIEQI